LIVSTRMVMGFSMLKKRLKKDFASRGRLPILRENARL